jgi:hypothetical protein
MEWMLDLGSAILASPQILLHFLQICKYLSEYFCKFNHSNAHNIDCYSPANCINNQKLLYYLVKQHFTNAQNFT